MLSLTPADTTSAVGALAAIATALLMLIVVQIARDKLTGARGVRVLRHRRRGGYWQTAEGAWSDDDLAILTAAAEPDSPAHRQVAGWGGVPGECGAECACGTTFDNFDTIAEAATLLDGHIAAANSPTSTPAVPVMVGGRL